MSAILAGAATSGLEVVPLMQTFGHMEFVLKHDAFKRLREAPNNFMDLCPLHADAKPFIQTLVDQVLALHPGIRRMHIGCDEVFGIATCTQCAAKVAALGEQASFLDHVVDVAKMVVARGVRPMIWHDMIESCVLWVSRWCRWCVPAHVVWLLILRVPVGGLGLFFPATPSAPPLV